MEEVAAVGRARGVPLEREAVARALALMEKLPPETTASMQRDIQAGRPSELVDQVGAVVRMGREASVPVPVHQTLFGSLLPQELAARGESPRAA
jgi:2-dehydropantoate 2-reductase